MRQRLFIATLALVGACRGDRPVAPPSSGAQQNALFSQGDAASCPTQATVTVRDEASLRAALAAARPGDVIALDGLIPVSFDVAVTTEGVTLTCAGAGSGLTVQLGAEVFELLVVNADRVTVDGLVLDGRATLSSTFAAYNVTAPGPFDVRLTNNRVVCPGEFGACALLAGAAGAIIRGNYVESAGSLTGLHVQGGEFGGTDGTRVERNTVITTGPSGSPIFGGIRVRDGTDLVVGNNEILGPWQHSIAVNALSHSLFHGNRADGAVQYGLAFAVAVFGSTIPAGILSNTIRANHVSNAGSGGMVARNACFNAFVGNNLAGFGDGRGLLFGENSGANTYAGNASLVTDNGMRDCDGDGVNDPNRITGPGNARRGGQVGDEMLVRASSGQRLR